jgi:predicted O-methyltransferase YrrM
MYKVDNLRYDPGQDTLLFDVTDKMGKEATHFLEHERSIEHIGKIIKKNGVSTSDDHGHLLYSIVRFFRCETIAEVGVAYEDTTRWLCQASPKSTVYGFDCWTDHGDMNKVYGQKSSQEDVAKFLKYFHNVENFKLIKVNTLSEKEKFVEQIEKIGPLDFVFIDGDHSYNGVSNDFELIYPHLSDKGIVVFHDTLVCDGTRQFANDLRTKYWDNTYDVVDMPYGNYEQRCGLTLLFKRTFHNCGIKIIDFSGSTIGEQEIYDNELSIVKSRK